MDGEDSDGGEAVASTVVHSEEGSRLPIGLTGHEWQTDPLAAHSGANLEQDSHARDEARPNPAVPRTEVNVPPF